MITKLVQLKHHMLTNTVRGSKILYTRVVSYPDKGGLEVEGDPPFPGG